MMLLREENLRLKGERHRPADLGVMIEQLRLGVELDLDGADPDRGWTMLGECYALQEALQQAQVELDAAITAVKGRLALVDAEREHLALLDGDLSSLASVDAA
jgi:hypothetical protein